MGNISTFFPDTEKKREDISHKVPGTWHCGQWRVMAQSDIDSDTEPGLRKLTIRVMGKRAVMSSHGGGHCLALITFFFLVQM